MLTNTLRKENGSALADEAVCPWHSSARINLFLFNFEISTSNAIQYFVYTHLGFGRRRAKIPYVKERDLKISTVADTLIIAAHNLPYVPRYLIYGETTLQHVYPCNMHMLTD